MPPSSVWTCSRALSSTTMRCTFLVAFFASQFAIGIAAKATDCLQVKAWCISDTTGCKKVWDIIEDVCNVTGESCTVKDRSGCNVTIQYLTDSYPAFRECSCLEDKSCNFLGQLGILCTGQGGISPAGNPETQTDDWNRHLRLLDINGYRERDGDCFDARQECLKSIQCNSIYTNFKRMCKKRKDTCSIASVGQQCLTAWQALQSTKLGNCVCLERGKRRCLRIWTSLFNNTCLQTAQRNLNTRTKEETKESYPAWGSSIFDRMRRGKPTKESVLTKYGNESYHSSPSCLKVTELCMMDQDICNKHFTPQKQVCPNSLNQCNLDDCHSAIRSFYMEIPPDLAQMLVFCRCHPSDELCLQAKEILHNNTCANHMDPKPTCLYLTERCLSDEVCRSRYEVFQTKCWERVRRICHHDKDCLSEMSWKGLTCSNTDECKAAYIDTRGTLLQMECTCNGVWKEERSLCELYQHMLNHQLCFNTDQASVPRMETEKSPLEEEFIATKSPSTLDSAMICVIAYVCGVTLIIGAVVTVIVYKTRFLQKKPKEQRVCQKSQQTPKDCDC